MSAAEMSYIRIFSGYFLGSSQNWTIRCFLGSFLKVKVQNGGYFLGCLSFKYLFWVLEILDFFFLGGGGGGGG